MRFYFIIQLISTNVVVILYSDVAFLPQGSTSPACIFWSHFVFGWECPSQWKPFTNWSPPPALLRNATTGLSWSIGKQVRFVPLPTELPIDSHPRLNVATAPPPWPLYHNITMTDRPTHPLRLLPTGLSINLLRCCDQSNTACRFLVWVFLQEQWWWNRRTCSKQIRSNVDALFASS